MFVTVLLDHAADERCWMEGDVYTTGAGVQVLLAAGGEVKDRDDEVATAVVVVAEDEHVPFAEVVCAGELFPAFVEVHVAVLLVDEDFHVPQRHHLSAGEPQLQIPASSEDLTELCGQPLRGRQSAG